MSVFDTEQPGSAQRAVLDSRLVPAELLFLVYVLDDQRAIALSLTEARPFVEHQGHKFSVINDLLYVDGEKLSAGLQGVGALECVVVPAARACTVTFTIDGRSDFVIGDDPMPVSGSRIRRCWSCVRTC